MKKLILLVLILSGVAPAYFEQNDGVPAVFSAAGDEQWRMWAGHDKANILFDDSSGILFDDTNESVIIGKFTPGVAKEGATTVGYYAGAGTNRFLLSAFGNHASYYTTETQSSSLGYYAGAYNTGLGTTFIGNQTGRHNDGDTNSAFGGTAFNAFNLDTGAAKAVTSVDHTTERMTISGGHGFGDDGTFLNLKITTSGVLPTGLTGIQVWEIISSTVLECISVEFTDAGSPTHTLTPQSVYTNSTALGYNAQPDASYQVVLGDTNVTSIKTTGAFESPLKVTNSSGTDAQIIMDGTSNSPGTLTYESDNDFFKIGAQSFSVDTDTLVVDATAHTVGIKTAATTFDGLNIGSADGSNLIGIYHDNTDAYIRWNDGLLILETDEGTNSSGAVQIKGKGTGVGSLSIFDAGDQWLSHFCFNGIGVIQVVGTSPVELRIQATADVPVSLFRLASEGETQELQIYGYKTGDAQRNLQIGVGIDTADTVSFDGLSNYWFDGNIEATGGLIIDTDTLVVDAVSNTVGIKTTATTFPGLNIGSADGSDLIGIYHDNTDAFIKWNDGVLRLETDEGTNTDTTIQIRGKGTGKGVFALYDQDDAEFLNHFCSAGIGSIQIAGASPVRLHIQNAANTPVRFFGGATEGETQELQIYGYRTGDVKRSLVIGVGVDADDTASFDGLSNYLFDGAINCSEITTPTAIPNKGALYTKSDNSLYFQDGAGVEHLIHGDSFSNIWFHAASTVEVAIATEDALTKIDSFTVVGKQDDLSNLVGSSASNELTVSSIGGGEYEISFHASITATGGADKEMMIVLGIELATPFDITDVTDNTITPIVITSTSHPLEDGDMVEIVGVLGNTAANGSFFVDNKAANTFEIVALDGTATTGNGDYNEGAPTGDVTIEYPGNMVVHREVRGSTLGAISATGLHDIASSDKLAVYVANLDGVTNLTVAAISFEAFRIGD